MSAIARALATFNLSKPVKHPPTPIDEGKLPDRPDSIMTTSSQAKTKQSQSGKLQTTSASAKTRLRKFVFKLHMVTGLAVGLYIFVMSLTGAALVFYDEISLLVNPKVAVTDYRQPLSRVMESVKSTYPNHKPTWIHHPPRQDSPLEVFVSRDSNQSVALVNPYTSEVIGEKTSLMLILRDLHFNLLSGTTGRTINGVGALFLLTLGITGFLIWSTRAGSLVSRMTVNFKANWKRVNFDAHSAVGIFALPMIFIWGTSAIYFAFPEPFEKVVHTVFASIESTHPTGASAPPPIPTNIIAAPLAVPSNSSHAMNIDSILQRVKRQAPGLHPAWIKLPTDKDSTMHISMTDSSFGGNDAVTRVSIESLTGQITHFSRPEDRGTPERFLSWLSNLHFGNFGGIISKTLWVVAGLTPALLFTTGALMWWNRVLSKSLRKSS